METPENSEERDAVPMSTKEQIEKLIEENYYKYPDAIDWMMDRYALSDRLPMSRFDKFMEQLNGNSEFHNIRYDVQTHNIVHCIKAYRNEHSVGLREAKDRVEWYIANNYWDTLSPERQTAYSRFRGA